MESSRRGNYFGRCQISHIASDYKIDFCVGWVWSNFIPLDSPSNSEPDGRISINTFLYFGDSTQTGEKIGVFITAVFDAEFNADYDGGFRVCKKTF